MAKIYMCEQGTLEWRKLRAGIPTASSADRIITPSGKIAKNETSRAYARELVAERLINEIGEAIDGISYMERGHEMEPVAVEQYEFANSAQTARVGLVTTDDGKWGASPDRIIVPPPTSPGLRAGVEIKSPGAATQVEYLYNYRQRKNELLKTMGYVPDGAIKLEDVAKKYRQQVQMQILVCEFEYVDFFSFHPRCPSLQLRVYPDAEFQEAMKKALTEFSALVEEIERDMRAEGAFIPFADPAIPTRGNPQSPIEGEIAREFLAA